MGEDSVKDQAQPVTPAESTALVPQPEQKYRKGRWGNLKPIDEKGRFIKTRKRIPSGLEMTRRLRKGCERIIEFDGRKMTALEAVQEWLLLASRGALEADPKMVAAVATAYTAVGRRALGKESVIDEDREAEQFTGIKYVIIPQIDLMNKEVVEEKPKEVLKPSFIDAEIITNPQE
jgi:hypothetical protein